MKYLTIQKLPLLTHITFHYSLVFQKEEKIRMLRQRLIDRDASKGGTGGQTDAAANSTSNNLATGTTTLAAPTTLALAQGKDSLNVVQADPATMSDFDSALGGGVSTYTRSSHASQSDFEFSESYL